MYNDRVSRVASVLVRVCFAVQNTHETFSQPSRQLKSLQAECLSCFPTSSVKPLNETHRIDPTSSDITPPLVSSFLCPPPVYNNRPPRHGSQTAILALTLFQDDLGKPPAERLNHSGFKDFNEARDDRMAVASVGPYANRLHIASDVSMSLLILYRPDHSS